MKLEVPAPIRKQLPLTPLVDVVFLLLMFFMLSSSFAKFGHIDMLIGRSLLPSAEKASASPGVIIRVGRGPTVSLNGNAIVFDELVAVLDDFKRKGVESAALQTSPDASVQDLVAVLERTRASKLKRLIVLR